MFLSIILKLHAYTLVVLLLSHQVEGFIPSPGKKQYQTRGGHVLARRRAVDSFDKVKNPKRNLKRLDQYLNSFLVKGMSTS